MTDIFKIPLYYIGFKSNKPLENQLRNWGFTNINHFQAIDGRKFIPSFDTTLLTPDLDKNRDYRLYQGANNPFYSMQSVPSGGIKNVYTEFKKGGRVGFKKGGVVSKGLDYLTGL